MKRSNAGSARLVLAIAGAAVLCAIVAVAAVVGLGSKSRLPTYRAIDSSTSIDEVVGYKDRAEELDDYISLSYGVTWGAVIIAFAVALIILSRVPRIRQWSQSVFGFREKLSGMRLFTVAALGIALAFAAVLLIQSNGRNVQPDGDEISYLESAMMAHDAYGPAGVIGALYSGRWGERNRHPLYIWLLTPLAARGQVFFVSARALSALLAALSIAVAFFVVWRLFGLTAAAVMTFLYGINATFLDLSSAVMCEMLLVSLVTLSFFFTVKGFAKEWMLVPAGALAGLAYMTKLSGIYLPVAFVAAALVVWRLGALRRKYFYLYFAAFLVTASPLLVRNAIRYHNPLSNYNFSLMWLDERQDTQTPDFVQGRTGVGDYFKRHGAADIGLAFSEGGEAAVECVAQTMSPFSQPYSKLPGGRQRYALRRWTGMAALIVAAVFLLLDADPGRRAFALSLALVVFLSTAWYARIALAPRFIFPYLPVALGYTAVGLTSAVRAWPYRGTVLACACLLGLFAVAGRLNIVHPLRVQRLDPEAISLANWLDVNLMSTDVYLVGPDDSLRVGWFRDRAGIARTVPQTRTIESLVTESRRMRARYVVISRNVYDARALQFNTSFQLRSAGLVTSREIPGWRRAFEDPTPPVDYIVFEVLEAPPARPAERPSDGK